MNLLENSEEDSEVDCREWRSDQYERKMASQVQKAQSYL
jgi:hypothetical protein